MKLQVIMTKLQFSSRIWNQQQMLYDKVWSLSATGIHKTTRMKPPWHNLHYQLFTVWYSSLCLWSQLWKRSGAWFFKGIPKYVLPSKASKQDTGGGAGSMQHGPPPHKYAAPKARLEPKPSPVGRVSPSPRTYNTWSKSGSTATSRRESQIDTSVTQLIVT